MPKLPADPSAQVDLFADAKPPLSPTSRRVVDAGGDIMQDPPERADFLHAVLCQVGMPRKRTEGRVFERRSGAASMILEAGKLWTGKGWKEQPLPYGTRPRLVMVHISGEAVRKKTREIEIGESMRDFLNVLGISPTGGPRGGYTMFKRQMEALAACRLILGMTGRGLAVTVDAKPISRFEAWLHHDGSQRPLWPGVLELSHEFYETLLGHAVPLDHRALSALKHSALALDVYSWLAHRLYRIRKTDGITLSWANLRDQFGQEYADSKDFKKEFRTALRQVLTVYPDARIESIAGGLVLRPSSPPLSKSQVFVSLPRGE